MSALPSGKALSFEATSSGIADEVVTFIEYHLPGLISGGYTLNLSQTVSNSGDTQLNNVPLASSYQLAVIGDRFSLAKPGEIVFCTFPENNGSGEYSNVLAHVVFTNQTFPWSREAQVGDTIKPGRATWLGVFLLDDDDVEKVTDLAPVTGVVRDLFPKSTYPDSTLPADTLSYFRSGSTKLELGESLDDPIQFIDLSLDLFWSLAPTLEDLHYLSHGRRVSLLPKATINGVTDVGEALGDFSIVFGNRLPQRQKRSNAYLVSLEEIGDLLPTDSGHPTPPAGMTRIRLAVLTSWSFFSQGAAADFDDRLLALNGRTTGNNPPDASNTNLRLTYSGSNLVVGNALSMGYVPLNETVRTGEDNVAWYRGPLTTFSVTGSKLSIPIPSPDKVLAFDPTTGLLDASYAAAWTVGRLLALQDKGFSTGLYAWKRGLSAQVIQEIENELLSERFAALSATFAEATRRAKAARSEFVSSPALQLAGDTGITAQDLRALLVHTLLEVQ